MPSWNLEAKIQEVRALLSQISGAQKANAPDPSSFPCTEEDRRITVWDGSTIAIRIHRPRSTPEGGCPGMVMTHGGGFCVGDLDSGARFCRVFARLGGVAVNVDYRLALEHPFPGPIRDSYDTLSWVGILRSPSPFSPKAFDL